LSATDIQDGPDSEPPAAAESFVSEGNRYQRTTIIIDRFADGVEEVVKHETTLEQPPCQQGGCRASSPDQDHCGFDPRSGLCDGRMT
jgi:hypothetical protein